MLTFFILFSFLIFPTDSQPNSNLTEHRKPISTSTKVPATRHATKPIKPLNKPTLKPPSKCHPFMIFCLPCEIIVSVIRTSMDKIIFVHKTVENLCSAILGRHVICDALIKVTMFYLDHTPSKTILHTDFRISDPKRLMYLEQYISENFADQQLLRAFPEGTITQVASFMLSIKKAAYFHENSKVDIVK
ncbi:unnamed protein product [Caenorhabditis brenneri]